jgi:hypothetical protein
MLASQALSILARRTRNKSKALLFLALSTNAHDQIKVVRSPAKLLEILLESSMISAPPARRAV